MDETESTCVNSSAVVKKENTDGIDSSCLNNSAVFIKEENIDETESTSSVTKIKQEPDGEIFCCAGLLPLEQEKNELVTVNDICEPSIVIKEEKTDYIEYTDFRNHVKEEEEMIMPDDGDQNSSQKLKENDQCDLKTKWKNKKRTPSANLRPVRSVRCKKDEERTHECQICGFIANSGRNLIAHVKARHNKHQCPHCKYAAAYPSTVKKHILSCHIDKKPPTCQYCGFTANNDRNIKAHIKALHKKHQCPYCKHVAAQPGSIERHIIACHTDEKPHKCRYCGFATKYANSLKIHVKALHWKHCPHCKFTAAQPIRIERHILSCHKDEKPFKCHYCDLNVSDIKQHVMTFHTEQEQKHHRCLHKIVAIKWVKTES